MAWGQGGSLTTSSPAAMAYRVCPASCASSSVIFSPVSVASWGTSSGRTGASSTRITSRSSPTLSRSLGGWQVIDVFAGTGALGIEAASRGVAEVLMVEQDAALAAGLRGLKDKLKADAVRVQRGDGVAALNAFAPGSADLVLLDPPFDAAALFAPALAAAARAVRADGFVYLEAPQAWDDAALAESGLRLHRHLKAGAVHAHLLRRSA